MSWDVELTNAGEVKSFEDGGTYVLGGTTYPELNITYNYGGLFREAMCDPEPDESNVLKRLLHGKKAAETTEMLEITVERLGTWRDDDYWAATPGNAGTALARLLSWAKQYPNGIWKVD